MGSRTTAFAKRFGRSPVGALQKFAQNRRAEWRRGVAQLTAGGEKTPELPSFREDRAYSETDLNSALESIAWHERLSRRAPALAGLIVESYFERNEKLQILGRVAGELYQRYTESSMLVFFQCTAQAMSGQSRQAHSLLESALNQVWAGVSSEIDLGDAKPKLTFLNKVWSVLDKIARDQMSWIENAEPENGGYLSLQFVTRSEVSDQEFFDLNIALLKAEPLLQGKHVDEYLSKCVELFGRCETLGERLKVVDAMSKQGMRRTSTYHPQYTLAKMYFKECLLEWEEMMAALASNWNESRHSALKIVRTGRKMFDLSRRFEVETNVTTDIELMTEMVTERWGRAAKYAFAMLLAEHDLDHYRVLARHVMRSGSSVPKNANDLRDFMNWAQLSEEYDYARSIFKRVPKKLHGDRALTMYIKILQLTGRPAEAAQRAHRITGGMFTHANTCCPVTAWKLLTRAGELEFLAQTNRVFSSVLQPKSPNGIIFVTPRNIEQLRRVPIVVLMELKRMGWAIVPLVEGILPRELTGIDAVDQFNGCLSPNGNFTKGSTDNFLPPENFNYVEDAGELRWDDIDLSHPIWEECAANRRRYTIDYTCPAMKQYLRQPVKWTRLFASVATKMSEVQSEVGIRFGTVIAFNNRLPDALFRFYCEQNGDADQMFAIHAANGYQNYFANFSVDVSTKGVMRNMTRHPETRSGSFPVPDEFLEYFEENRARAPQILQQVSGVTKVKRSTEGLKDLEPDAKVAIEKIKKWRKHRGKVACAFGKVVCDSGVPFDGGPAHENMKDWLNHTIESVKNSDTLLLIKPHPHELKEQIACFLNQRFFDLIEETDLPENVILCGHRWFDIAVLEELVDLGLIYNGTTSVELGVLGIPSVLCSHFAPIDYPVGHLVPTDREHYRRLVRFEEEAKTCPDLQEKAACWLHYMGSDKVTLDYRYHARMITNEVVYPSWWFEEDLKRYLTAGDRDVQRLARRAIN